MIAGTTAGRSGCEAVAESGSWHRLPTARLDVWPSLATGFNAPIEPEWSKCEYGLRRLDLIARGWAADSGSQYTRALPAKTPFGGVRGSGMARVVPGDRAHEGSMIPETRWCR